MPNSIIPNNVPSPIDLRLMSDAQVWEQTAIVKRPWRTEFFSCFVSQIAGSSLKVNRLLELGSGPGFLAKCLLELDDNFTYTLLDFSSAMHSLAKKRLGSLVSRAEFVERNFKESSWTDGLGQFECVVTNQAIHELRHKRHAPLLHAQVKSILAPCGFYLVCDHYAGDGGMKNDQLYMSVAEQRDALLIAGFNQVEQLLIKGGLVLHRAS
jgi:ubiquinone/menaquinone biosynthesis C-methylase UbiE